MKKKYLSRPIARLASMTLAVMLALGLAAAPVAAASAPRIEDVEYEGQGKVEVEFYGKVRYQHVSVTAKDSSGTSYTARVLNKDNDDITFKINNYKAGTTYRFTIKGIKKRGASGYTSVSSKVRIPDAGKVVVKEVDYDAEDLEVDFEFKGKVSWQSPTVTITDSTGTSYVSSILEKDSDSIEVKVSELSIGSEYTYTISGVKNRDGGSYTTVTGTFRAYDD